jgi:hypothetical protein
MTQLPRLLFLADGRRPREAMNLRRKISVLRKLADSDDWWDREIAGFALRDLIEIISSRE